MAADVAEEPGVKVPIRGTLRKRGLVATLTIFLREAVSSFSPRPLERLARHAGASLALRRR